MMIAQIQVRQGMANIMTNRLLIIDDEAGTDEMVAGFLEAINPC